MDYYYLCGIVGALLILIAFFLCNYKNLNQKTLADEWLNMLGSILLVIYAWNGQVWPFVILNTVWGLWSAKVLVQQLLIKK